MPFTNLIPQDLEIDINYNKESQESYAFLVKRTPINFQKNRTSKNLPPEVISEIFFDDDSDDCDDAGEDNERDLEDDTLEYSSDDSEDAFQVNFDAPEVELEENNSKHAKGLDSIFS
jgi:hypothetical protein